MPFFWQFIYLFVKILNKKVDLECQNTVNQKLFFSFFFIHDFCKIKKANLFHQTNTRRIIVVSVLSLRIQEYIVKILFELLGTVFLLQSRIFINFSHSTFVYFGYTLDIVTRIFLFRREFHLPTESAWRVAREAKFRKVNLNIYYEGYFLFV